jgi:hypothetical protein
MSEHIETGFEELIVPLQAPKGPAATNQQSQQQPGPNAGSTAAQLPANVAMQDWQSPHPVLMAQTNSACGIRSDQSPRR